MDQTADRPCDWHRHFEGPETPREWVEFYAEGHQEIMAAFDLVESPIEQLLFLALLLARPKCDSLKLSLADQWHDGVVLLLVPQYTVARFRADFLLCRLVVSRGSIMRWSRVIVECDGSEYHHATAAQAVRDRARDRDLESRGYAVVRFSGRAINAEPFACATAAWELLVKSERAVERPPIADPERATLALPAPAADQDQWRRVVLRMEERRPPLASCLAYCEVVEFSDSRLELRFAKDSFFGRMAGTPESLADLRWATGCDDVVVRTDGDFKTEDRAREVAR